MAAPCIEILYLRKNGPAGRRAGTIIKIRESIDGSPIRWGSDEKPPLFGVVRIFDTRLERLPPDLLEYGGHISKILIDETKMSVDERDLILDPTRYTAARVKHTITPSRLILLSTENPELVATEEKIKWPHL